MLQKNNRKCSKIMEKSLLFHCQNSQNAKENRCPFRYLKKWIITVPILFFPSFLMFVGAIWEESNVTIFPGNVACHFHPKKAFFTKTYDGMRVSFHCYTLLAMLPGGRCIKLQIRGSWVQVPPDPVVPSLNPHPCSGLSKVAGCQWKSPPTWLVSAGYSAWHFFMDGVF